MSTPNGHPANWYPDPSGSPFLRYWDGAGWTSHTRPLPQAAPTMAVAVAQQPPAAMTLYPQPVGVAAPIGVWRGPVDSRPYVPDMFVAIRVCAQKYASFDGRAGRAEFWYAHLAMALAVFTALFVFWIPVVGWLAMLTLWLLGLAAIVPSLAVTVRRLRDAGFHWAWIFIGLAPFGSIALLIFCTQRSKYP